MNDKETVTDRERADAQQRSTEERQGFDLGDEAGGKTVTGTQGEERPPQPTKDDNTVPAKDEVGKVPAKNEVKPVAPVVALRRMVLYWALPEDAQHGIEAESDLVAIIVKVNVDDSVNLRVFAHDSAVEVFKAGITQGDGPGQFRF